MGAPRCSPLRRKTCQAKCYACDRSDIWNLRHCEVDTIDWAENTHGLKWIRGG
jgi:hypothetical protein